MPESDKLAALSVRVVLQWPHTSLAFLAFLISDIVQQAVIVCFVQFIVLFCPVWHGCKQFTAEQNAKCCSLCTVVSKLAFG